MDVELGMSRRQAYTLYVCHMLSTWNSRSYEFAAVLFATAAYPGGLRAASLTGVSIGVISIFFGPAVGRWVDRAPSRLATLLTTIVVNRISTILACALWLLITSDSNSDDTSSHQGTSNLHEKSSMERSLLHGPAKSIAFAFILALSVSEGFSRKANMLCTERDWIPILAPNTVAVKNSLTQVNAVMARVDMLCKVLAPIVISFVFSTLRSIKTGIWIVILVNILSLCVEWMTAKSVWNASPELKEEKKGGHTARLSRQDEMSNLRRWLEMIMSFFSDYVASLKLYFESEVWAPSLSMCFTQPSILSTSGVTVAFFLNSGYSLRLITAVEALSAFFELSSTALLPIAVKKRVSANVADPLGFRLVSQNAEAEDEEDRTTINAATSSQINAALTMLGIWGIVGMVGLLLPTVPIFLDLTSLLSYPITRSESSPSFVAHPYLSIVLFFCLSASRLCRGSFALVNQQFAQARIAPNQRASFAGAEQALMGVFSLVHYLGTAIWSSPGDFGWLAVVSFVSISSGAALYVIWVWRNKKDVRMSYYV